MSGKLLGDSVGISHHLAVLMRQPTSTPTGPAPYFADQVWCACTAGFFGEDGEAMNLLREHIREWTFSLAVPNRG